MPLPNHTCPRFLLGAVYLRITWRTQKLVPIFVTFWKRPNITMRVCPSNHPSLGRKVGITPYRKPHKINYLQLAVQAENHHAIATSTATTNTTAKRSMLRMHCWPIGLVYKLLLVKSWHDYYVFSYCVGLSVHRSFCPSIMDLLFRHFEHYCPCSIACNWWSRVYGLVSWCSKRP